MRQLFGVKSVQILLLWLGYHRYPSNNPFIDISLKLKASKLKSSELENRVKYLSEMWLLNQHFWKTTLERIFLL